MPAPVSSQRLARSLLLATAYAASCAVFPDNAVLPVAGEETAGATAQAGSPVAPGGAGSSGAINGAGSGGLGSAGAGAGDSGAGGAVEPSAGAAGEGGTGGTGIPMTCDQPQQLVVPVREDTWIDAVGQDKNHGDDEQLFVSGGVAERRMLLKVDLPAAPAGAWLVEATLELNLESNEDETRVPRSLGVYRLTKDFVEGKATWQNFSSGMGNQWDTPGADFGGILARATLQAETSAGPLSFDVTKPLSLVYAAQAVPLGLIIREVTAPPPAPAALAFTSLEGNASVSTLTIEYCEP